MDVMERVSESWTCCSVYDSDSWLMTDSDSDYHTVSSRSGTQTYFHARRIFCSLTVLNTVSFMNTFTITPISLCYVGGAESTALFLRGSWAQRAKISGVKRPEPLMDHHCIVDRCLWLFSERQKMRVIFLRHYYYFGRKKITLLLLQVITKVQNT